MEITTIHHTIHCELLREIHDHFQLYQVKFACKRLTRKMEKVGQYFRQFSSSFTGVFQSIDTL